VKKGTFVTTRFQLAGAKHPDHAAEITPGLSVERLSVAITAQTGLEKLQPFRNFSTFESGLRRVTRPARDSTSFRLRLCSEQKAYAGGLIKPLCYCPETGATHKGGGNAK
jgi:hypothetical protein